MGELGLKSVEKERVDTMKTSLFEFSKGIWIPEIWVDISGRSQDVGGDFDWEAGK